jgi:hypothetical protein
MDAIRRLWTLPSRILDDEIDWTAAFSSLKVTALMGWLVVKYILLPVLAIFALLHLLGMA